MSIRVLLADDHEMVREGLRAILERDGEFEVVGEAADGRAAVRLARVLRPEIVIVDVGMPELNGIDATRQIVGDELARVVVLSSHSDRRFVLAALRAGASAYVVKGAAAAELARALRAVHAGRKFISEAVAGVVVEQALGGFAPDGDGSAAELAPREREVLQLLAEGGTSGEIAAKLSIAQSTVETHRRNIMRKLDLHSVADLTRYAIREGLTTP